MAKMVTARRVNALFSMLFMIFLWHTEAPAGITDKAWHIFVTFMATIIAIMLNPMPIGVVTIAALTFCIVTKLMTLDGALSGFSSSTVWLVVTAFFIARSLIKTGLGARIAYYLISKFGRTTIGVSYSLILTELVTAPAIPSASARGGGILYPIVKSLIHEYTKDHKAEHAKDNATDHKKPQESRIAKFLIMVCFHANVITSAMFLTAMAANPIAVRLAADYRIDISWADWGLAAIVPGLISLALLPPFLYWLCKPESIDGHGLKHNAQKALSKMGPLSIQERITLTIFVFLVLIWAFEEQLGVSSVTAALVGFIFLLITNVLTWDDVLSEKSAWDTFIWFSVLITLAGALSSTGVTKWLSHNILNLFENSNKIILIFILLLGFFYAHYFFVSVTVHITVMYSTFLEIFLNMGLPALPSALLLALLSVLSAGLTHYGIASAPIFFGGNYITTSEWWRVSGIASTFYFVVWIVFGGMWWYLLGWL